MIRAALTDLLSGRSARVGDEGDLLIRDIGPPRAGVQIQERPMSEFFTDSGGASEMTVNGSVTPVEFNLQADGNRDRFVKSIIFTIVDSGATLSDFGAIGALTNGVQFEWNLQGEVVLIESALKSNYDFIRLAGGQPAFGDGITAFRANDIIGTSEGYMAALDITKQFGFAFGLRLSPQTEERLTIRVRDDLSVVDSFTAKAFGFDLANGNGV